ncbi:MAG TPA: hypothetical protein VGH19_18480 [Verrucomicrobiae bacterium]
MSDQYNKDFDELSATRSEMLRQAHSQDEAEAMRAREAFFLKYRTAVLRYALSLTHGNLDTAEEIAQDFARAFLEGRFANATGANGRFRYYLKTSVKNLFRDRMEKQQRNQKRHTSLDSLMEEDREASIEALTPSESPLPDLPADEELDRRIRESLAPAILRQTWNALADYSRRQKPDLTYPSLTLYQFLWTISESEAAAHQAGTPLKGEALCQKVNEVLALNPPLSYASFRQRKSRGSIEFARLLLDEIRSSFECADPDIDMIEEECIALGFHKYVERAWPQWKTSNQSSQPAAS